MNRQGFSAKDTPEGVRDILPPESTALRAVERKIRNVLEKWGYQELITPAYECYPTLLVSGEGLSEKTYKFTDSMGRVLALRPDITTSVARCVATRLGDDALPVRLYYDGEVFRMEPPGSGNPHQFIQIGAEIIGCSSPSADAEVVALAVETLKEIGLKHIHVGLGHLPATRALLKQEVASEEVRIEALGALQRKDLVVLKRALPDTSSSLLWKGMTASEPGARGLEGLITRSSGDTQKGLEELRDILFALTDLGIESDVHVDLGIVRDVDYYTGMVFEVYGSGLGRPLGGGGRYDNLLAGFGRSLQATGFALNLPRIMDLIQIQGAGVSQSRPDCFIKPMPGQFQKASIIAKEIRAGGGIAEVDLSVRPYEESMAFAASRGYRRLIVVGQEDPVTIDLDGRLPDRAQTTG